MGVEGDSGSSPALIVMTVVGLLLAGVGGLVYYAEQQRRALRGDQQQQPKKRLSKKKLAKEARANRAQFSRRRTRPHTLRAAALRPRALAPAAQTSALSARCTHRADSSAAGCWLSSGVRRVQQTDKRAVLPSNPGAEWQRAVGREQRFHVCTVVWAQRGKGSSLVSRRQVER